MQVRRDGAEKETAQFGFRRALAGARGERVSTIVEALGFFFLLIGRTLGASNPLDVEWVNGEGGVCSVDGLNAG
jgi:hypothetical protein